MNICRIHTNKMTIDSGWVKIIKGENPSSFSGVCPAKLSVAFIDGQIKLMCGAHVKSWSQFLNQQFVNTIEMAFKNGAKTVILGFDDYTYVPTAKNMTQQKRKRSTPLIEFGEQQELPNCLPENWMDCIKNRTFKMKVITFVIKNIRRHYEKEDSKTVIIDWNKKPEMIGHQIKMLQIFENNEHLKRGECDIKAFSWMELGPLLLISTDGDYLPLALAQIEKQEIKHDVYIYRMLCRVNGKSKRKADGSVKREYEYINVQSIYKFLCARFPKQSSPAQTFSAMVALTGCDFCMNLPAVGPTKIWKNKMKIKDSDITTMEGLFKFVLDVYNDLYYKKIKTINKELNCQYMDEKMACTLYDKFSKAVKSSPLIADRTKDSMWNAIRMEAHIRNTLWTLSYWTDTHYFQDPLSSNFGFEKKKNIVAFVGT